MTRTAVAALLLALAGLAHAAPARLDFDLALDPLARRLEGSGTVTVPAGDATTVVLAPRFTAGELRFQGRPLAAEGAGRWQLPASDRPRVVSVRWSGALAATDGASSHRDTLGRIEPAAGPEGSFLPAASGWYPAPEGLLASHRVRLKLPAGQRGLVAGRLLRERDDASGYEAAFDFPHPGEGIDLMAGPYTVAERRVRLADGREARLRTWFHPAIAGLSEGYLESVARYLERFEARIGPYAFTEFSVVSSPTPTGFGMPTLTYLGVNVLKLPFIRATSLGHEVLHNWWGNGVRVDWRRGNWSEGLTTLMADHALRMAQSPEAGRQMRWGWLRDFAAVAPGTDTPLDRFTARTHGAASAVGYGKSAMLFHMVRAEIGEAAFNEALRDLWRSHAGQAAGWRDLQAAFEKRAGRPLAGLIAPMLSGTGAPMLVPQSIRHDATRGGLVVTFAEPVPYSYALPVAAWHGERAEPALLPVRRGERSAVLPLQDGRVPDALQVDPDFAAWRRLGPGESPPLLRDAMLAPDIRVLVASDGDDSWRLAAGELATRMLEAQRPPTARIADLDAAAPLLVIGRHEDIERLVRRDPRLARPAALARMPDATLWATRAANGAPRVLVSVEDTAALIDLHRRAPHYGAQGHVGFRNGRAIASGIGNIETPKVPVTP
ncbi:MAG: M1 family metallopeptidase [Betaproteobacteria bacterium]